MATLNPYLRGMYEGVLAEPIAQPAPLGLLNPIQVESAAPVHEARAAKIPALFAHFEIDADRPDSWELLALALAERHVPGFRAEVHGGGQWVGPIFNMEFMGLPNPYLPWQKRRRGRPSKPRFGAAYGLLGTPIKQRGKSGRPGLTHVEKRELVDVFDETKRRLGAGATDLKAALAIATSLFPKMNARDCASKAKAIRRKAVRLRNDLRRFDNP